MTTEIKNIEVDDAAEIQNYTTENEIRLEQKKRALVQVNILNMTPSNVSDDNNWFFEAIFQLALIKSETTQSPKTNLQEIEQNKSIINGENIVSISTEFDSTLWAHLNKYITQKINNQGLYNDPRTFAVNFIHDIDIYSKKTSSGTRSVRLGEGGHVDQIKKRVGEFAKGEVKDEFVFLSNLARIRSDITRTAKVVTKESIHNQKQVVAKEFDSGLWQSVNGFIKGRLTALGQGRNVDNRKLAAFNVLNEIDIYDKESSSLRASDRENQIKETKADVHKYIEGKIQFDELLQNIAGIRSAVTKDAKIEGKEFNSGFWKVLNKFIMQHADKDQKRQLDFLTQIDLYDKNRSRAVFSAGKYETERTTQLDAIRNAIIRGLSGNPADKIAELQELIGIKDKIKSDFEASNEPNKSALYQKLDAYIQAEQARNYEKFVELLISSASFDRTIFENVSFDNSNDKYAIVFGKESTLTESQIQIYTSAGIQKDKISPRILANILPLINVNNGGDFNSAITAFDEFIKDSKNGSLTDALINIIQQKIEKLISSGSADRLLFFTPLITGLIEKLNQQKKSDGDQYDLASKKLSQFYNDNLVSCLHKQRSFSGRTEFEIILTSKIEMTTWQNPQNKAAKQITMINSAKYKSNQIVIFKEDGKLYFITGGNPTKYSLENLNESYKDNLSKQLDSINEASNQQKLSDQNAQSAVLNFSFQNYQKKFGADTDFYAFFTHKWYASARELLNDDAINKISSAASFTLLKTIFMLLGESTKKIAAEMNFISSLTTLDKLVKLIEDRNPKFDFTVVQLYSANLTSIHEQIKNELNAVFNESLKSPEGLLSLKDFLNEKLFNSKAFELIVGKTVEDTFNAFFKDFKLENNVIEGICKALEDNKYGDIKNLLDAAPFSLGEYQITKELIKGVIVNYTKNLTDKDNEATKQKFTQIVKQFSEYTDELEDAFYKDGFQNNFKQLLIELDSLKFDETIELVNTERDKKRKEFSEKMKECFSSIENFARYADGSDISNLKEKRDKIKVENHPYTRKILDLFIQQIEHYKNPETVEKITDAQKNLFDRYPDFIDLRVQMHDFLKKETQLIDFVGRGILTAGKNKLSSKDKTWKKVIENAIDDSFQQFLKDEFSEHAQKIILLYKSQENGVNSELQALLEKEVEIVITQAEKKIEFAVNGKLYDNSIDNPFKMLEYNEQKVLLRQAVNAYLKPIVEQFQDLPVGKERLEEIKLTELYFNLVEVLEDDTKWKKDTHPLQILGFNKEGNGEKEFIALLQKFSPEDKNHIKDLLGKRYNKLVEKYNAARRNEKKSSLVTQLVPQQGMTPFPLKDADVLSAEGWGFIVKANETLEAGISTDDLAERALNLLRMYTSKDWGKKIGNADVPANFKNAIAVLVAKNDSAKVEECERHLKALCYRYSLYWKDKRCEKLSVYTLNLIKLLNGALDLLNYKMEDRSVLRELIKLTPEENADANWNNFKVDNTDGIHAESYLDMLENSSNAISNILGLFYPAKDKTTDKLQERQMRKELYKWRNAVLNSQTYDSQSIDKRICNVYQPIIDALVAYKNSDQSIDSIDLDTCNQKIVEQNTILELKVKSENESADLLEMQLALDKLLHDNIHDKSAINLLKQKITWLLKPQSGLLYQTKEMAAEMLIKVQNDVENSVAGEDLFGVADDINSLSMSIYRLVSNELGQHGYKTDSISTYYLDVIFSADRIKEKSISDVLRTNQDYETNFHFANVKKVFCNLQPSMQDEYLKPILSKNEISEYEKRLVEELLLQRITRNAEVLKDSSSNTQAFEQIKIDVESLLSKMPVKGSNMNVQGPKVAQILHSLITRLDAKIQDDWFTSEKKELKKNLLIFINGNDYVKQHYSNISNSKPTQQESKVGDDHISSYQNIRRTNS